MFACIHCRSVSPPSEDGAALVDLAFTFSPLVEQTTVDTVVLDVSGQDLLFDSTSALDTSKAELNSNRKIAEKIVSRATELNLKINVSIAAGADVAIHAAQAFKGITVIDPGEEGSKLGSLSIKKLNYSLAGIDAKRAEEIQETFALWGIRTFSDFGSLPLTGVAERLGQEGVLLQKLAQGKSDRRLNLVRPPIGFEQSLELEHPVTELEPLSFILFRLIHQLCANLQEYALATNELRLQLKLEDKTEHDRAITLPVPMLNPKTLLRLLLFDIEAAPPAAPILAVTISAQPIKPRTLQTGLFIPLAPEPEKLEITLARLAKLVGSANVGSPELLDTHRPDTFRMKRFSLPASHKSGHANPQSVLSNSGCVLGFRIFRPAWRAVVQTTHGQPMCIHAEGANSSTKVRGKIICASGPWRSSGDWWRAGVWARDEWDIAVADSDSKDDEVLCRIYRELQTDEWFVTGVYD